MRKLDLLVGLIIFVFTCAVFSISRIHQFADSNYSMLVSESLLHHRTFALDNYSILSVDPKQQADVSSNKNIYQLERVNGHIYYYFPPGSSILSIPHVAVMNAFGISATNPDGTYNAVGEADIEVTLAALLMAALTVTIFYTSRLLLPVGWSALIALSSALGTQIYSTTSRALWSDTWGIFLIGFVVWILLAHETGKRRIQPVLLASLLSWAYFVRPTFCLPIIAVTIYLLIFHRNLFVPYALTGALWFASFITYSWHYYRQPLPNYYAASRLSFDTFWIALAANLISPSRGLLVFVPILIFVLYLLLRYRKELTSPRLVAMCLSVIVVHLFVVSCFPHWWGGHSFGPRFTAGLVPWLVLLGILATKAMVTRHEEPVEKRPTLHKLELAAGSLLLICSLTINTLGATAHSTWLWNIRPDNIDEHPERIWDWKHPQFLAR